MDTTKYSKYSIRKKQFLNEIKTLLNIDYNAIACLKNYFKYLNTCLYDKNYLFLSASRNGHMYIAKFLVINGMNIHFNNNGGFLSASEYGYSSIVKFLVKNGANIHSNRDYGLRWASKNGHLFIVKFLVFNGANIHAEDNYALSWSIINGYLSISKFLIKNGADIYSSNVKHWIKRNNLLPILKYLKKFAKKKLNFFKYLY